MKCAWNELLSILPPNIRQEVDKYGRESATGIRLRVGSGPELLLSGMSHRLHTVLTQDDIQFVIHTASRYSPWAATTISRGYITAPGGHRIGICGEAVVRDGTITGIRSPDSLYIRVARDFPGISRELPTLKGSILILGAPGWGKTTLLRDLIRCKSNAGACVSVVDEREELFPQGMDRGPRTEVLRGCPKSLGLDMLLRTMNPDIIALDEITEEADCAAMQKAAWCGVDIYASAHASGLADYLHRDVYAPLVQRNLFNHIVILHQDRSWHLERSMGWTSGGSVRC